MSLLSAVGAGDINLIWNSAMLLRRKKKNNHFFDEDSVGKEGW